MEYLTWVVAIISVTSAILNIYKHWLGFAGWTLTNIAWVAVCIWQGNYAQAAMFTVYLGLAVWGLVTWRRAARRRVARFLEQWLEIPDTIGAEGWREIVKDIEGDCDE